MCVINLVGARVNIINYALIHSKQVERYIDIYDINIIETIINNYYTYIVCILIMNYHKIIFYINSKK